MSQQEQRVDWEEELDFLTEILTSPSQDNITVLLWSGGEAGGQDMFIKFYNLGQPALPTSSMVSRLSVSSCTQSLPLTIYIFPPLPPGSAVPAMI